MLLGTKCIKLTYTTIDRLIREEPSLKRRISIRSKMAKEKCYSSKSWNTSTLQTPHSHSPMHVTVGAIQQFHCSNCMAQEEEEEGAKQMINDYAALYFPNRNRNDIL